MRRLLFPLEFIVAFVAVQFALEVAQKFMWRFIQWRTDVYFIQHTSLNRFLPSILLGLIVGYIFVSLDYVFNSRTDPTAKTTQSRLMKYGARSGLCAICFWMVWNFGVMLPELNRSQQRRYHTYGMETMWLDIAYIVQPVVFAGLVLWALVCSLKHRSNQKL